MENIPCISIAQNDLLILCRERVAVDCTNHTKHILRGEQYSFLCGKSCTYSYINQHASATHINHRASGTYINHRASGTYIIHCASGTYINHRANGTYITVQVICISRRKWYVYQSPRKWYMYQSPRRKLLIKQNYASDKTVTYITYLILL